LGTGKDLTCTQSALTPLMINYLGDAVSHEILDQSFWKVEPSPLSVFSLHLCDFYASTIYHDFFGVSRLGISRSGRNSSNRYNAQIVHHEFRLWAFVSLATHGCIAQANA